MDLSDMRKNLLAGIGKPDAVDKGVLEVLEYAYGTHRDIEVTIEQPEFTSVCPLSGLPDFGSITICYVPRDKIVELKSLKYYLLQYRNVGIFYEHVVNVIVDDLVDVLAPKSLKVTGTFTPRGGITTTVRAAHGE
jgi:7-cyano-7-deazaguanine reductase